MVLSIQVNQERLSYHVADVSIKVAEAVAKKAQEQGLARAEETDMAKAVRDLKWYPEYK